MVFLIAPQPSRHKPARRSWATALKLGAAVAFLFVTGGPSVMAQLEDPATFWRQERQRQQAGRTAGRSVEQRPTRLIRGAAPKKGFTRVAPEHPAPAIPAQPPLEEAPAQQPVTPAVPSDPASPATQQAMPAQGQPAAAVRIVVLGDNVAQLLARGLEMAYQDAPQIAVVRQTRDSSGLVNTRFFDWNEAAKKLLASGEKIHIAVMMLGSNDAQDIVDGRDRKRLRSDEWNAAYKGRIEAIAAQFRERKIPLIWVGMPIMRGDRLAGEMLAFNELFRETVQRAGGVYVDVWEGFTDDRNRFSLFGPDVNGQIVKLRTGDGVHFTPAGARKLAYFLEAPLKRLIEEKTPRSDAVAAAVTPPSSALPTATPSPAEPAKPAQPEAGKTEADKPSATPPMQTPSVATAPPAPVEIPVPLAIPSRASAGPVLRLTAPEVASDGELVKRSKGEAASAQSALLQRRLSEGAPMASQPGRADDFSWPRK